MKAHEVEVRVRYQETDNMGVVYYGNYFVWFEIARTEHFRSLGLSYRSMEEEGVFMMVASASCQYKSPARYDDIVRMHSWISELKNSSLTFQYKLFVGDRIIATGESVQVFTGRKGKPVRMPEEVRAVLTSNL